MPQTCTAWNNLQEKELLSALYDVLEITGLKDCAKPANIPFSQDGRIAFVDTQSWKEWPVDYNKLTDYLSPDLQVYWKNKIK